MSVELLTEHHLETLSLKEGYTGLSESTLVKIPPCWKSIIERRRTLVITFSSFPVRRIELKLDVRHVIFNNVVF